MPDHPPALASKGTPWYRSGYFFLLLVAILLFRLGFILQAFVADDPDLWLSIGNYLHLLLPAAFAIILWRRPASGCSSRPIGRRLLFCVLVGWFIQIAIRWCIVSTAERLLDYRYGGNAVTLFGGWLTALLIALPFALVALILDVLQKRRKQKATLSGSS